MSTPPERFLSLDVFRGITICFMIIVNTPGSGALPFAPLEHAVWHGFTPTDLVFPSFLFAVGNAMSFTMKKQMDMAANKFIGKILKRSALIFLIGFLLYWFPFVNLKGGPVTLLPISGTRILGVLQRIALCYFFASIIIRFFSTTTVYILSALFLAGYWVILLVSGDPSDPLNITKNAVSFFDLFVMGRQHLYHHGIIPFDPEGILSTLPAIVNVIIGYNAGKFIQVKGKSYETISKLLLTGGLLIFLALCWNMAFPINKKLWTSPFVLLTTGLDLVILSTLVYVTEVRKWNNWNWTSFFTTFGKNPLFIYLLSEIIFEIITMIKLKPDLNFYQWINKVLFQFVAPGAFGSLLFAVCYMLLCWLIAWGMDKKKIYVRV